MDIVLLLAGAFFALVFILNNLFHIIRGKTELKFWGTTLAFLVLVVTLLALVQNYTLDAPLPTVRIGAWGIAGAVIITGLLLIIPELRRKNRNMLQSRGILSIGVGLLLIIATLTIPFIAAFFAVPLADTPAQVASGEDNIDLDTTAYRLLIESASETTGVDQGDLIVALTDDTSIAALIDENDGDREAAFDTALSAARAEIEAAIASGAVSRLDGTLLLTNLETDLREKFTTRISSDQMETLAPLLLASSTPAPTGTHTPENTSTPTQTPSRTPTLTRTPRPTASATPTRQLVLPSRTPTATPTLPNPCLATVDYNLNVRTEPDAETSEVIAVIPFDTVVQVYASNEDQTWWYVQYEGQAGWIDGEFVSLTASCSDLPVRD